MGVVRRATSHATTLAETLSEKSSSKRTANNKAPRTPTLKLSALNKWGSRRVLNVKETEKFLALARGAKRQLEEFAKASRPTGDGCIYTLLQ